MTSVAEGLPQRHCHGARCGTARPNLRVRPLDAEPAVRLPALPIVATLLASLTVQNGFASPTGTGQPLPRDEVRRGRLPFETRVLLHSALVNGTAEVPLVVAAVAGKSPEATKAFERLGGRLDNRIDTIDYFRGRLPTGHLEALSQVTEIADLQIDHGPAWIAPNWTWDTDADYWRRRRLREPPPAPPEGEPPQEPPARQLTGEAMARDNPYLPTRDIGAPQFVAEHPTFDGRGVGVALMSERPNTAQSVFGVARALDGHAIDKFVRMSQEGDKQGDGAVDPHGTQVAAIVAGSHFLGGEAAGVAPASQLLTGSFDLDSIGAWVEAFARAAQDDRVDVLTCARTPSALPNDGETFLDLMLSRIVRRFNKPIVWAAGNQGPSLQTGLDGAAAEAVLSVGGYLSRASGNALLGYDPPFDDNVWNESSRGPTSIGAVKPDILAPSASLVSIPCWIRDWASLLPGFRLPRCYAVSAGTSLAAPFAAGAAALLISAAKQTGLTWNAEDLLDAIRHSARPLPDYGADQQGYGLLQVGEAWKRLSKKVPRHLVVVAGPSSGAASELQKTPGAGPGFFEREGWKPGDRGQRRILLRRGDGPAEPLRCTLTWLENDGTFSAPRSVALPLNEPISIPIDIRPASTGVHSAILRIEETSSGAAAADVGVTVVVARPFTARNGYTVRDAGLVANGSSRSIFVDIPMGTPALEVDLSPTGPLLFQAQGPRGADYDSGQPNVFPPPLRPLDRPATILVKDPYPGVWEFSVSRRPGPGAPKVGDGAYDMAVSLLGAMVSRTSKPGRIRVRNMGAAIRSATLRVGIGRRTRVSLDVSPAEHGLIRDLVVLPGTSLLKVAAALRGRVRGQPDSILNVYLYDCSRDGHCYLWDVAASAAPQQELTVINPTPGHWKALIDCVGAAAPRQIAYEDVRIQAAPALAGAEPPGRPRGVGEEWMEAVDPGAAQPPSGEGELVAFVGVVDLEAEKRETAHPGYRWDGLNRDDYRPAYLGWSVFPIPPSRWGVGYGCNCFR